MDSLKILSPTFRLDLTTAASSALQLIPDTPTLAFRVAILNTGTGTAAITNTQSEGHLTVGNRVAKSIARHPLVVKQLGRLRIYRRTNCAYGQKQNKQSFHKVISFNSLYEYDYLTLMILNAPCLSTNPPFSGNPLMPTRSK